MKNWAELPPMTTARSSASAVAHDGKIFVLGGSSGQRLNTVEVLDLKMNKWVSFKCPMAEARSAGAAAVVLNRLYAIGGTDNSQAIHASVEMLVGEEGAWSFRTNFQNARMDLSACAVADSTVLIGGGQSLGGQVLNQTEMFFPELNEWQAGPALLLPRYGHVHLSVSL
jgi:N-acetylneuraminic acid mutarotase